jgi:hypothetical protein
MSRNAPDLVEGPSQKNRALQDVEYMLHMIMGVPYPSSDPRFEPIAGTLLQVNFSRNAANHVLVSCPNGATYNLNLALKNANLEYLFINSPALLSAIAEKVFPSEDKEELLSKTDQLGSIEFRITKMEEKCVVNYSGTGYGDINNLLRGKTPLNADSLVTTLCFSLLTVSAINKNIDISYAFEKMSTIALMKATMPKLILPVKMLTRKDDANNLPPGIVSKMQKGGVVSQPGMLSFSEISVFSNRTIETKLSDVRQKSIASVSILPGEKEVLFPQMSLFYMPDKNPAEPNAPVYTFNAIRVWGLATEHNDHYVVECALAKAFDYLKAPYKDNPNDSFGGVNRPNHALAHHVRVVTLIDPVLNYLKKYTNDPKLKKYIENLTSDQLIKIKVLAAFSKTGRESEASSRSEAYARYQKASADYMATFMREEMGMSEAEIEFYKETQEHSGNPNYYSEIGTEEERQEKYCISHIFRLAHRLDLPRCYTKVEYKSTLAAYGEHAELKESCIVEKSDAQKEALDALQKKALVMLVNTGDHIVENYTDFSISSSYKDTDLFQKSNTDLSFCLDRCVLDKVEKWVPSVDILSKKIAAISKSSLPPSVYISPTVPQPVILVNKDIDATLSKLHMLSKDNVAILNQYDNKENVADLLKQGASKGLYNSSFAAHKILFNHGLLTDENHHLLSKLSHNEDEYHLLANIIVLLNKPDAEIDASYASISSFLINLHFKKNDLWMIVQKSRENLNELETLIPEKLKELRNLKALISEKLKESENLETLISEKSKESENLETLISEKSKERENLETLISEKFEELGKLETLISKKLKERENLETLIPEKLKEIEKLEELISTALTHIKKITKNPDEVIFVYQNNSIAEHSLRLKMLTDNFEFVLQASPRALFLFFICLDSKEHVLKLHAHFKEELKTPEKIDVFLNRFSALSLDEVNAVLTHFSADNRLSLRKAVETVGMKNIDDSIESYIRNPVALRHHINLLYIALSLGHGKKSAASTSFFSNTNIKMLSTLKEISNKLDDYCHKYDFGNTGFSSTEMNALYSSFIKLYQQYIGNRPDVALPDAPKPNASH